MNTFSDQLVLWVINVLIHATVLTAVLLCVAMLFRRRAAMRYWILCCGLVLVLASPAVSALVQSRGSGWLVLAPPTETIPAAAVAVSVQPTLANDSPMQSLPTPQVNASITPSIQDANGIEEVASAPIMSKPMMAADVPANPSAATPAVKDSRSPMQWLAITVTIATVIWAVGAMLLLLRMTIGWIRLAGILRRAEPITDPDYVAAFTKASALVGCHDECKPRLVASDEISGPLAAGIFAGSVVLPKRLIAESSPTELAEVLVHEVAHVVRRDQIVVLLQNLVAAIYWPHPLVRKLNRELAKAREEVCDNFVLATTDAPIYSRTLLSLAQLVQRPETIPGSVGFFASRWKLEQRVAGLLDESRDTQTILSRRGWAFVLASTVGLLTAISFGTVTMATAQNSIDESTAKSEAEPSEIEISGIVREQSGGPVGGAKIWLAVTSFEFNSEANMENREGLLRELGATDGQGRFEFLLDAETTLKIRNRPRFARVQIVATSDGHGMDWLPLDVFQDDPIPSKERDLLQSRIDDAFGDGRFASRTLVIRPESQPVRGRLVDLEGNRLSNVTVFVESLRQPNVPQLMNALENAWKQGVYDAMSSTGVAGGLARSELQKLFPPIKTDENGEFQIRGIGDDQLATLVFQDERIEARPVHVVGREMETVSLPYRDQKPDETKDLFVGRDFNYFAAPSIPVEGTVTDYDTGKPIAGVLVSVERLFRREYAKLRLDTHHMRAVTDQQGRFRIIGMPPGDGHIIEAVPPKSEPYLPAPQEVSLSLEDGKTKRIEIQVKRGVWIEGRITDKQSGEPRSAAVDYMAMSENPYAMDIAGWDPKLRLDPVRVYQRYVTDSDGRYRLPGLPGPGVLLVTSLDPGYPLAAGAETIDGYDPSTGKIPTTPVPFPASDWHLLKEINPAKDATSSTSDLTLDGGVRIPGRVVGPDGISVSDLYALGLTEGDPYWTPNNPDKVRLIERFNVNGYDGKGPRQLFFKNQDETLVGQYRLEGTAPPEIAVKLEPSVRVTGRLIENETGLPAPRYFVFCEEFLLNGNAPPLDFMIHWCHSDNDGEFEIKGLMAGHVYKMKARGRSGKKVYFTIDLTDTKPGDVIDLEDVPGPSVDENTAPKSTSTMMTPKAAPYSETFVDMDANASPVTLIRGIVQGIDGKPIRDAMIAVLANRRVGRSGMKTVSLGETRSDSDGEFNLDVKFTDDMHSQQLLVRSDESELKIISLEVKSLSDQYLVELKPPQPLQIRLVDLEGQPADKLTLDWRFFRDLNDRPAIVPPRMKTDANGSVTIEHVAEGDGVWLEIFGDERFAPQTLSINTGEPEERPERDATYRCIVKNVPVDEVVTIPLSPAQVFAGRVLLGDSEEPAANAQVSIWSSQQETGGSMVRRDSMTDDQGRFRVSPYPGLRYGIQVYPPDGTPYQSAQRRDLRWSSGEETSAMEVRLPQGAIAEGQVINSATGEPIAGVYVQYLADSRNPNESSGFIEGWQAAVRTDEEGRYRVTALPGRGTLIMHAGEAKPFVMKTMGSREIRRGEPGGTRYYAHGFQKIDLDPSAENAPPILMELQPSVPLRLRLVNHEGEPVQRASYASVLTGHPLTIMFRGSAETIVSGQTVTHGLASGDQRRIHVWNEDRKLGGTATLVGGEDEQTIALHPAGSVTMRFVTASGDPITNQPIGRFSSLQFVMTETSGSKASKERLLPDMDFYENFHRKRRDNESRTDDDGQIMLDDLIPGVPYEIHYSLNEESKSARFVVEPGEQVDLGDIINDGPEELR